MMNQTIRIIGGKYRGRKISFPAIPGLRPTSDRVRETLFNWLMHDIRDSCVLDAFSGSGALGFEAASRGAKNVVMVDVSKLATTSMQKQAGILGIENVNILCQNVENYLLQTNKQFDIVFLDPPFDIPLLKPTIDLILKRQLIVPEGLLYVETRASDALRHNALNLLKEKIAGQVCYRLFRVDNTN